MGDAGPQGASGMNASAEPRSDAAVHDYLTRRGGAERAAVELARRYGNELNISLFLPAKTVSEFRNIEVGEMLCRIPEVPEAGKVPRHAFGWAELPSPRDRCAGRAVQQQWLLRLGPHHRTQGGMRLQPAPVVVCRRGPLPRRFLACLLHLPVALLQLLDRRAVQHRDTYLAISHVNAERLTRAYRKSAIVIPPPVTFGAEGGLAPVQGRDPDYFLALVRHRGYKNTDVIVQTIKGDALGRLVVVSGVRNAQEANSTAHVRVLSPVPEDELRRLHANGRGTIGLSPDDLGLSPVGHVFGKLAMVVAAGGYHEICIDGVNAVHIDDARIPALAEGVSQLAAMAFAPQKIREAAKAYSPPLFWAAFERRTSLTPSP